MKSIVDASPTERLELYNKTISLHKEGLGYKKIARLLNINEGTVNGWLYQKGRHPLTHFRMANLNPSPELSYIIGVYLGDANITSTLRPLLRCKRNRPKRHIIQLEAKDRDFVQRFARCLCKVLDRKKELPIWHLKKGTYGTHIGSWHLHDFLSQNLDTLKPFIEAFPADFIRGLADSEGSVSLIKNRKYPNSKWGVVRIRNTNLTLLQYVQELLKRLFNINSKIYISAKKGSAKNKKDVWELVIQKREDLLAFSEFINFNLERKKKKLNQTVTILTSKKGEKGERE